MTKRISFLTALLLFLICACGSSAAPAESSAEPSWAEVPASEHSQLILFPETVTLTEDVVASGLRSVAEDGQTLTFAANTPGVTDLAPGTVVIVGGVAIVRVDSVESTADGIVLSTEPASLAEAVEQGHLDWDKTVDFASGGTGHFSAIRPRLGLESVAIGLAGGTKTVHVDDDDYAVDATFTSSPGALDIAVDAVKALDCVEIHLHGSGHVQRFRSTVSLDVADHQITQATANNSHLEGSLDLSWSADKPAPDDCSENKTLELPVGGKLPFIVGGLPFWLTVKSNIAFVVALTGRGAVAHGSAHLDFGGSQTFHTDATGSMDASFSPERVDPVLGDGTATNSAEISGFSANLSLPRIELGAGISEASAMVHFSLVTGDTSLTPGALGLQQCQRHTLSITGNVGASAELFGHAFETDDKEIFRKELVRTIPDGVACDPGSGS